ncbi:MAG: hypothetical protein KA792_00805 [Bacteroidales bacterium]|nr:hypothetical protein [Bacteroidales bacterium]
MKTKQQTSKEYFRALSTIYYAMIAGQIFFVLISFFLVYKGIIKEQDKDLNDVFSIIIPVFVLGVIMSSNILFRNKLKKSKSKTLLIEKMNDYRSALLIRYALLEGPCFLSIVAYLLCGVNLFLMLAGVIILIFSFYKPSVNKAVIELELNQTDTESLKGISKY